MKCSGWTGPEMKECFCSSKTDIISPVPVSTAGAATQQASNSHLQMGEEPVRGGEGAGMNLKRGPGRHIGRHIGCCTICQ